MGVEVFINSYDLEKAFGVCLEDGGLSRFETPPTPKEPFFNEWPDESGRDYDTSSPVVYQSQVYEVPFLIIGKSMADYRKKKREFLELISINGEFDFQIVDWGEAYRLRYKSTASWDFINTNLAGETSARFVLRFENNHGLPVYMFRYLVDNFGRYIVINGGKKIMVKTSY